MINLPKYFHTYKATHKLALFIYRINPIIPMNILSSKYSLKIGQGISGIVNLI